MEPRHTVAKLFSVTNYPGYLRKCCWKLAVSWLVRRKGVDADSTVVYLGTPVISLAPESRITIGPRCVLCSDSRYTALGVNHPVVLRTLRPGANLTIGADSGISGAAICAAQSIEIGSRVLLGADVRIFDTDFHALSPDNRRYNENPDSIPASPVRIGDNVFVGTGAIILRGTTIGENSVIGAGSVVKGNVPPNVIAAGNPARVVRPLDGAAR